MKPGLNYLLLFSIVPLFAAAQKLPKIQTAAVRAPVTIKIDGKTTEWNDSFQAYNSGQHIYYTISNDDENLYLTARMDDDILGNRKIFKGGITFAVIPALKKAEAVTVTFPVISPKRTGELEQEDGGKQFYYRNLKKDAIANKAKIDALISTSNAEIKKVYKQIHITGIPEITDTLTSIYNAQNIMVAASLDNKMRYIYELAIPLKYLEAAISDVKRLKYKITLRTLPIIEPKRVQPTGVVVVLGRYIGPGSLDDQFLFNNTDFSGEYTLAK